jgi:hypothetical protein
MDDPKLQLRLTWIGDKNGLAVLDELLGVALHLVGLPGQRIEVWVVLRPLGFAEFFFRKLKSK